MSNSVCNAMKKKSARNNKSSSLTMTAQITAPFEPYREREETAFTTNCCKKVPKSRCYSQLKHKFAWKECALSVFVPAGCLAIVDTPFCQINLKSYFLTIFCRYIPLQHFITFFFSSPMYPIRLFMAAIKQNVWRVFESVVTVVF